MLVLKLVRSEGIDFPDGERMNEVDEEGYKYPGVPQLAKMLYKEMKESVGMEI